MFVSRLNPVAQHAFQRLMAPEKPSYLASYSMHQSTLIVATLWYSLGYREYKYIYGPIIISQNLMVEVRQQ